MDSFHQSKSLLSKTAITESEDPLESIFERGHKRKKYENFSDPQLEILNNWFAKSIYPKIEDFDTIAQEIQQPKKKIQNWFKYKRRLVVLENENKIPQYKTKKVLSQKVFEILKDYFKVNQNPSLKEFRELAKKINLKEKQIISWFTYRRRKLKLTRRQQYESKTRQPLALKDRERIPFKHADPIKTSFEDAMLTGDCLRKKMHFETPESRFLALPDPLRGELQTKKEYVQSVLPVRNVSWSVGADGFLCGNQYPSISNATPNPFMNFNCNMGMGSALPLKYQNTCLQNQIALQAAISRNISQANLANLQILYNKMMPKMNMLPYFLKENLGLMQGMNPQLALQQRSYAPNELDLRAGNHCKMDIKQENV